MGSVHSLIRVATGILWIVCMISLLPNEARAEEAQDRAESQQAQEGDLREDRVGILLEWAPGPELAGLWEELRFKLGDAEIVLLSARLRSLNPGDVVKFCREQGVDTVAVVRISTLGSTRRLVVETYEDDGNLAASRELFSRPPSEPVDVGRGSAPLSRAEIVRLAVEGGPNFYTAVGRLDLAERYQSTERTKRKLKVVGGVLAAGGFSAFSAWAYWALLNCLESPEGPQTRTCPPSNTVRISLDIALGMATAGGALALTAFAFSADPLTRKARVALAKRNSEDLQDHNGPFAMPHVSDVRVAASPTTSGNGGLMSVSGRF
jgi:hypothetical protein